MPPTPILIVGAGIVGLSLALELRARGFAVIVYERSRAMTATSQAAAGMLAAEDPHNPPALRDLARFSAAAFPAFLDRLEQLSGIPVPFQTVATIQHLANHESLRLPEHSVDPRQLAPALRAAAEAAGVKLYENQAFTGETSARSAAAVVYASGAWFAGPPAVFPRKGQMLRVRLPHGLHLTDVHRSEEVYVVPRTAGPQAGTALIGATVEDAGFDLSTDAASLAGLRQKAARYVPELGSEREAPTVEAWAGLRPATCDDLPFIGQLRSAAGEAPPQFVAAGHFRNGILLAPGTATALADVMADRQPAVDLGPFDPARMIPNGLDTETA